MNGFNGEENRSKNRSNIIFPILFSFGLVVCIVFDIILLVRWRTMPYAAAVVLGMTGIIEIVWLIMALVTYWQSDNRKYREPDEEDSSRKKRMSSKSKRAVFILMALLTLDVKALSGEFTAAVFNYRWSYDKDTLLEIAGTVEDAYECMLKDGVPTEKWEETWLKLREGTDITEWTEPYDAMQEVINGNLRDFKQEKMEIKDIDTRIYCAVGGPVVWVKVTDNVVYAEVKNAIQKPGNPRTYRLNATKRLRDIPGLLFIYMEEYIPESYKFSLKYICAVDTLGNYYVMKDSVPSEEGVEWIVKLKETGYDPVSGMTHPFYHKFDDKLCTDEEEIWDWYQMYTEMADDADTLFCDEAEEADLRKVHQIKIYGVRYDEEKNPVCDLFYISAGDKKEVCGHGNAEALADWIMTNVESIRQKTDE